jgi:hypothetical protein
VLGSLNIKSVLVVAGFALCLASKVCRRTGNRCSIGCHRAGAGASEGAARGARHVQDAFMSMAQWMLSGVITDALVLAGVGWYLNKVNYDPDVQSLQDALDSVISKEVAKATRQLENAMANRQKASKLRWRRLSSSDLGRRLVASERRYVGAGKNCRGQLWSCDRLVCEPSITPRRGRSRDTHSSRALDEMREILKRPEPVALPQTTSMPP